jgi:hypothetical protein
MITGVAAAADPVRPTVVVVNQKESGIFKVIYKGDKVAKVNMKIYDAQGSLVFSEMVSGVDGFIRPVNFNGMNPGEYTIEVTSESGKEIQKIKYEIAQSVNAVHVAKMTDANKYLLAVAKPGSEEKINVSIYDGDNNIVHHETLTVKDNLGLVYNLKNVKGQPTFEITDNTGASKIIRY